MHLIQTGLLSLSLLLLAGCGSKKEIKPAEEPVAACMIDGIKAPGWICIPHGPEGTVAGLGTAAKNPGGDYGFQLSQAKAGGRDAIARNIETKVQNMFKTWQRSTGQGSTYATFENNYENVSRQTAQLSLQNSKVVNSWQSPKNGTLYVLMTAPVEQVREKMMSSLRNEEALWQQFQAKKAMEELDAQFQKEMQNP